MPQPDRGVYGILRSTRSRYSTGAELDADAQAEIEATLEFLAPYLRWPAQAPRPDPTADRDAAVVPRPTG